MLLRHYLRSCSSAWCILKSHGLTEVVCKPKPDCSYAVADKHIPNIEFLAFLRHHGFPSPLLDWSESPYVAAFFALRELDPDESKNPCIHIYTHPKAGENGAKKDKPHIKLLQPFMGVTRRHVDQQCWYTIALRQGERNEATLCSHVQALEEAKNREKPQYPTKKIVIDRKEQERALADLAYMNVTPFTLFGGIDALIETITHRVL